MLLFSTSLMLDGQMTKENFIRLIKEWNENTPHEENHVKNVKWMGEDDISFGDKSLRLGIRCCRDMVSVRHQKKDKEGILWSLDHTLSIQEQKIVLQLNRSFTEDAEVMDKGYSTPLFIKILMEGGYVRKDHGILPSMLPHQVTGENIEVLLSCMEEENGYELPVVYVSKTILDKNPLDAGALAYRLKGVAHVLVEDSVSLNAVIERKTNVSFEKNGEVGIYYPGTGGSHKKYAYRSYSGSDVKMAEQISSDIIRYCTGKSIEYRYTWDGVSNALLLENLKKQEELTRRAQEEAEREKDSTCKLLGAFDEEFEGLQRQVEELTRRNETLAGENIGLKNRLSNLTEEPVIVSGEEPELYEGEAREVVLDILEQFVKGQKDDRTRRKDIISNLLQANSYEHICEKKKERIKNILKGYTSLTGSMKKALEEEGFTIAEDGKHYKLIYHGDERYMTTLSKTASDKRAGANAAGNIIRDML